MSIVITGNPGVGKHTIAKKIAKMLKLDLIDINQIVIEEKIYEPSEETKDVDINKLKKILKSKLKEEALIVGHLAPYVIPKSQASKVIILRKSP
ncbi:MAG: AAA family ATPase, partial [Nitrosopumilaceae archaeon]|nr:AAA family ATPase [Nitrosopumilaceae archaeon]